MSDTGSGNPQWGQQNPYNEPDPGQPPRPPYGPTPVYPPAGTDQPTYPNPGYPPASPPPGYQQPSYPPPVYPPSGQPDSGPPQYSQPGQPPYGDPQYVPPGYPAGYGQQPPYGPGGPGGPGGPTTGGGKSRKGLFIGAGVVAALVVVGIVLLLTVGKSSGSSSSPVDAAKTLMSAAKAGDKNAVLNSLCSTDRALFAVDDKNPFVDDQDKVTSYSVGAVTQKDSTHATVKVTVSTSGEPAPDTEDLPVQKEGGSWKVCVTDTFAGGLPSAVSSALASGLPTSLPSGLPSGLPTSLPTSLPTDLPSGLPTSLSALCNQQQTSSVLVAAYYVGLAESGDSSDAQGCVYKDTVALTTTQKLSGKDLSPTGVGADGTLNLAGDDGSKVVIKTTKESDGNFYVTSVTIS